MSPTLNITQNVYIQKDLIKSYFWSSGHTAVCFGFLFLLSSITLVHGKVHGLIFQQDNKQQEHSVVQQETELLIGVCYMCSFMWGRPFWTQWFDFVPKLAWMVWWRWRLQLEDSCRWGKAYPAGCAAVGSFSHHFEILTYTYTFRNDVNVQFLIQLIVPSPLIGSTLPF